MSNVTLIVLCAGNSTRFEHKVKKQWLRIENEPLWVNVTKRLCSYYSFSNIIITSHTDELSYMENFFDDAKYICGGSTRQESIKNSLEHVQTDHVMITDVARACIPKEVVLDLISLKDRFDCVVPTLNVSDTVVYNSSTINRDHVKLIQTPQLSKTSKLKTALKTKEEFTDESSAIKAINGTVEYTKGSLQSKKLTFGDELKDINCLKAPSNNFFTGFGIDIHKFEENKKMYLGGVHIPCDYGFKAHSDGDVVIHSIIDSLLGATGAGDIGEFFPDDDPKYKGLDSKILLKEIVDFIYKVGYEIVNIDLTILAQQPKINPFKNEIKKSLSTLLSIDKPFINIKATTNENMGFIGRKEGIAVHSVSTLKYYNWKRT